MSAILCVQKIIARAYEIQLSDAHAEELWKAARADLNKRGSKRVVKAIKEASTGSLDTLEREMLGDAMARVMAGKEWPSNGDRVEDAHFFGEQVFAYFRKIGAITVEQDPYLKHIVTLVEVDEPKGSTVRVQKRKCGLYDIARKKQGESDEAYEIKHPDCTADDAIRALGHYLHQ